MNVAMAAELFSRKAATGITYLSILGELPQEALATAKFCERINDLFDSFNGLEIHQEEGDIGFKFAVTPDSGHFTLWTDMYREISHWEFYDPITTKRVTNLLKFKNNFIWTLQAMASL